MQSTSTETLLELIKVVQIAADRRQLEDVALALETELTGGDLSEHENEPIFFILDSLNAWLFAVWFEHDSKHPERSTEELWDMLRKTQATLDKTERMLKKQ